MTEHIFMSRPALASLCDSLEKELADATRALKRQQLANKALRAYCKKYERVSSAIILKKLVD